MNRHLLMAALLLLLPSSAQAQDTTSPNSPPVAFPQVTAIPVPLQSTSGRFSSLNPTRQLVCRISKVMGRVVSARLIQLDQFTCLGNDIGLPLINVLMNVRLDNPADAAQMAVGRRVALEGTFKIAEDTVRGRYHVFFLIAEKARLVAGDPLTAPAPASTSYMMCQPPELDTLASQLGRELCVQSTIMANLKDTRPALETAARALVQDGPKDAASSDPISCNQDSERSDAHLPAIACARSSYWGWWSRKWGRGQNFTDPAPP